MLGRRFSAAMDPEKLKKLLQSLRKSQGYLSGLTWAQMGEVFTALDPGWKLEKIVGIVQAWSNTDEASFWATTRETTEKRHAELAKKAVTSLPSNPKANELYVLDLAPIVEGPRDFTFTCKPWLGVEGWKITSHTGKIIEVFPDSFRFGDLREGYRPTTRNKIPIYDALPRMKKETDWVEQINKSLNEETFVPSAQRTRDSTGSCPVCFQNVKITDGTNIALHGYKRPGRGEIHGSCSGTKYPAFELSVLGTKTYLEKGLRPLLNRTQGYLDQLEQDAVDSFPLPSRGEPRRVDRGDKDWDRELAALKVRVAHQIKGIAEDVEVFVKLVQNWKLRPLPKEGEKHIDWYYGGQQ